MNAVGSCLSQNGKPIAYHSKILNEAQRQYPTIDREYLGIKEALRKWHYYVYGQPITVLTDHLPLIRLFQKPIDQVPMGRLRNIRAELLPYDVKLKYVPGKQLVIADCLSRLYSGEVGVEESWDVMVHAVVECSIPMHHDRLREFKEATREDEETQSLLQVVRNGWPKNKHRLPELIKPFFNERKRIHEEAGLIYVNDKMLVPRKKRTYIVQKVHEGHQGETTCILRAGEHFCWPGMNSDIRREVQRSHVCQKHGTSQRKIPMVSHHTPSRPFQQISTGIMDYGGKAYLVLVDDFSKYLEIEQLPNKTAAAVTKAMIKIFSTHGLPEIIHSDNMPFADEELKQFYAIHSICHVTSSPGYPQSNGCAEKYVGIAKKLMKKAEETGNDILWALLQYRSTPIPALKASPAEILFSRRIRTYLPVHPKALEPKVVPGIQKKTSRNQGEIPRELQSWNQKRSTIP